MTRYFGILGAALTLVWSSVSGASCLFPGEPGDAATVSLKKIASGLDRPVAIKFIPGSSGRYYIVEQSGKLRLVASGQTQSTVALDLSSVIDNQASETGFLGFAFHPQFAQNRRIFVNYTTNGRPMMTHVSEFKVEPSGLVNRTSEKVLLKVRQPYNNHNGGDIHFGPDGYLYIALGDGGKYGDPHGNSQNIKVLLGKILRIDVDRGSPYGIPSDNPRFGVPGERPEIFAYGLRNPWRFSFDRITGDLWAGDVGQDELEEIDIVVKGGNYGWRIMEGTECYNSNQCDRNNLKLPITEYPRSEGVSVTGGYVYRGTAIPELTGTYIYGDFGSGTVWGLRYDGSRVTSRKKLVDSGLGISSFGEDADGELYVLGHTDGGVYKVVAAPARAQAAGFPTTLTATGCFSSLSPLRHASGVQEFSVNSPLWSDGALKTRFIFVPPGQQVTFSESTPWLFPEGTVLIKHFMLPQDAGGSETKLIETRFLVKRADRFVGYTYRWNAAQSDGVLLSGAATSRESISTQNGREHFDYYFPSSGDCQRCHTPSGRPLAFETLQLHKPEPQSGQNQISRLVGAGVLSPAGVPADLSQLPALVHPTAGPGGLAAKAKSYLHTQCASCHNPANAAAQAEMDLRFLTPLAASKICNRDPLNGDLGVSGSKLIKPGEPEKSLLWLRMVSTKHGERMPPLATSRADQAGAKVIEDWIKSLTGCE